MNLKTHSPNFLADRLFLLSSCEKHLKYCWILENNHAVHAPVKIGRSSPLKRKGLFQQSIWLYYIFVSFHRIFLGGGRNNKTDNWKWTSMMTRSILGLLTWTIERGVCIHLHVRNMIWYMGWSRILCKDTYFSIFCHLSYCKLFTRELGEGMFTSSIPERCDIWKTK